MAQSRPDNSSPLGRVQPTGEEVSIEYLSWIVGQGLKRSECGLKWSEMI